MSTATSARLDETATPSLRTQLITQGHQQKPTKRDPKDRRRSERRPYVVEAWLASPTATDEDERTEVTSVNISRHGLAFDHTVPLPLGTFHLIDVTINDQLMTSEIRVMTCRKVDGGKWEIGAEFC